MNHPAEFHRLQDILYNILVGILKMFFSSLPFSTYIPWFFYFYSYYIADLLTHSLDKEAASIIKKLSFRFALSPNTQKTSKIIMCVDTRYYKRPDIVHLELSSSSHRLPPFPYRKCNKKLD